MTKTKPGARGMRWALIAIFMSAVCAMPVASAAVNSGALSFSQAFYSVSTNSGAAFVTINRTDGSGGSVVARYITQDSTALAGTDYSATYGTVNWNEGDVAPKTFLVPISTLGNGAVSFNVALLSVTGAAFGEQISATVYIYPPATYVGVASPGNIEFSQASYSVAPDSNAVTATINRVGGSNGSAVASFVTIDPSSLAGVAFSQIRGTVSWDDGDSTPKSITIPLVANAAPGADFQIALVGTSGAVFGDTIDASIHIRASGAGSVALYWLPPSQNTDGSALSDLAGYYIFYGADPTQPTQCVQITDPSTTSLQLSGLGPGTWYFAAAAYNSGGVSSDLSEVLATTIQ